MKSESGVSIIPCKVNGLNLNFVFDTGAGDVSISITEASFMLKNGYLSTSDIIGTSNYLDANGDINEGININLKEIEIAGLKLFNVKASIVKNIDAPLLLGQSAISKLGKIQLDLNLNTLTILSGNGVFDYSLNSQNLNQEEATDFDELKETIFKSPNSLGNTKEKKYDNTQKDISNEDSKKYFSTGMAKYKIGDYKGAITDFIKAIEIDPLDEDAYFNKALAKYKLQYYRDAISDFSKLIEINPVIEEAYFNRALCKYKLQDYSGTISDYSKTIEINPKYTGAYNNRGVVKDDLKDYQGAITDYNKAIEIDPKYFNAYLNRGIVKSKLKDFKGEILDYNKAIEINPKYARAYYNRGIAKDDLKDYSGAIEDYTKAIEINPKHKDAYLNRGVTKGKIQDYLLPA